MRVLFVYPNLNTQMGFNQGLAMISAFLKRAGHETRLVNLNENLPPVPTREEILAEIRAWNPGVLAASTLSQQYAEARDLVAWLRKRYDELGETPPVFVVGGVHPSMVPEQVMADGVWDHVAVGECEDAMVDLVERIDGGDAELISSCSNFLSWKSNARPRHYSERISDNWKRNPVRPFPNISIMPMADYELFDTQRILDSKNGWAGLITSRGCPYRCTYCLNHEVIDTYRADLKAPVRELNFFRFRHPEEVLDEMRFLLNRYERVNTFIMDDDLFTQNVEHAVNFCKAYEESEINVPFVVNAHVKQLDERVANALKSAGCTILKMGIESGSPRVRKEVLQRPMSDNDIFETVRLAETAGLHSSGFVMVGLPGETHEERWETVDLLARLEIGRFRSSMFYPFPGTGAFKLSVDGGFIDPEKVERLTDFTESSCLDFGAKENLFIDKLAVCLPWFVNARMAVARGVDEKTLPAVARYAPLMERVLAMGESEWELFKPEVRGIDAEAAAAAAAAGEVHYAIKFNAFMGVRDDYYLAEERAELRVDDWVTAAALPK
jgi:radical SAM superfamily enzyme YgiQ (UPF0313 family)